MNTERLDRRLGAADYARLIDAAKARARQAHSDAIADAWLALRRGLRSGWQAVRSAQSRPARPCPR